MITKAYACINLNDEQRALSSSGGIYPILAGEILKRGGVVFAACYEDNLDVVHKAITNEAELAVSQGSKYVCSNLGNTFNTLLNTVASEKPVMFVGTPCQCSGLVSFLKGKNVDRDKVLIVDFVCHGVPGKKAWNGYKESLMRSGKELVSINMRDKTSGWSHGNYSWKETIADGEERITPRREVAYMKGMLSNLYLRPSCYTCVFKGVERKTDFTMGDYWGIWNHNPDLDDNKGTSLLLIHSEIGLHIFESIKPLVRFAEANIEKAIEENLCIVKSPSCNKKRNVFFDRLNQEEDFVELVKELTKPTLLRRTKHILKASIKRITRLFGENSM